MPHLPEARRKKKQLTTSTSHSRRLPSLNQTIRRGREARPRAGFGSHQAFFFHPPNPSEARPGSLPSLIKPLLPGVSAPPRRAEPPVRQQTSAPCSPLTPASAAIDHGGRSTFTARRRAFLAELLRVNHVWPKARHLRSFQKAPGRVICYILLSQMSAPPRATAPHLYPPFF